jgi:host factor-I protein
MSNGQHFTKVKQPLEVVEPLTDEYLHAINNRFYARLGDTDKNVDKVMLLQNCILEDLRKRKAQVSIFLTNGIRLRGCVFSVDNHSILLKAESTQLVFKHAIATIMIDKAQTS